VKELSSVTSVIYSIILPHELSNYSGLNGCGKMFATNLPQQQNGCQSWQP
jgi:hypothetical protein